jgi:hypothetical protein
MYGCVNGIKNQKGETVLSGGGQSSHKRYLEAWDPGEPLDDDIGMKLGTLWKGIFGLAWL